MINIEKTTSGVVIRADKKIPPLVYPFFLFRSVLAHLGEIWFYRELMRNLVVRDLKVRYRNSVLGVLWSLGNPLLMMLVFTMVFTIMAPSSRIEKFPVFVLCGILPWNFFSSSVVGSIRSIVGNAPLVNKVYFPREILPVTGVLSNLVNFLVALIVLFAFIVVFQVPITVWVLFLPVVILVQLIFTIGVGLIMATANVFYRDTQVIMEVLMLAWFFMTPVFYSVDILPDSAEIWGLTFDVARWLRILNPMASIITAYRDVLYGGGNGGRAPGFDFFMRTAVTSLVVLGVGILIFYRYSRTFAEEV